MEGATFGAQVILKLMDEREWSRGKMSTNGECAHVKAKDLLKTKDLRPKGN